MKNRKYSSGCHDYRKKMSSSILLVAMTTGRRCPPVFYWLPWLQEEDVLQDFAGCHDYRKKMSSSISLVAMTTGRKCPPVFYWLPWLQEEDVLQYFTLLRRLLLLVKEAAGILSPHDCTWVYKECFYNIRWSNIKIILLNYITIIMSGPGCAYVAFTILNNELLKISYRTYKWQQEYWHSYTCINYV